MFMSTLGNHPPTVADVIMTWVYEHNIIVQSNLISEYTWGPSKLLLTIISIMGYKLGYHILVLPNQVLLINSVLTNEVLLCVHAYKCM